MMSLRISCLLLVLLMVLCETHARRRWLKKGRIGRLKFSSTNPTFPPVPTDQWYTQLLDHFEPTDNRTWQQRYQVMTDYYKSGGPVFIMMGGEGSADADDMVYSNWIIYAQEYNALLFQIEHRFYGESHPTSDMSVDNLKYLTSEQALADAAYFVSAMNVKYNLTSDTKWISFGGSYAGNLAAWFRYKYPHLIHGTMSASGPVHAQVDFYEYMNVVKNSLGTYGKSCTTAVQQANQKILKLLRTSKGRQEIKTLFNLCSAINVTNHNDVYNLLETMADNVAGIVQYDNEEGSEYTIDNFCTIMTNETLGGPVNRYAAVNEMFYGSSCLDFKYEDMINDLKVTAWPNVTASVGDRQWTYQTCTEFGFFQTSETKQEFYAKDFPLEFFLQQCSDIFGKQFTSKSVYASVNRTNTNYGGLNMKATRVVYVHGSLDPWHVMGIYKTRIPQSPAILINGTAHCANMDYPTDTDPAALKEAREKVGKLIGKWLKEK